MNPLSLFLFRAKEVWKAFIARPFLWLSLYAAFFAMFPIFFCLVNFAVAITPAEAIKHGDPSMPANWEAGVMNHGQYIRWYTIEAHPFFFWGLIAACFANLVFIYYLHKKSQANI